MSDLTWPLATLLLLLAASAALTAALARFAWQRRHVPGAAAFSLAALLLSAWSLAAAAEAAAAALPAKLIWHNLQYLNHTTLPVMGFVMVAEYAGASRQRLRRLLPWLLVLPVVTLALVFTNHWHGLMARDLALDLRRPVAVITKTYGPWFWVHTFYSYLLLALSLILLVRAALPIGGPGSSRPIGGLRLRPPVGKDPGSLDLRVRPSSTYRGQALALLAAMLLPLAWNVVYVLRLGPGLVLAFTPVIFALSSVVVVWGLFRFRLFDVMPVARDRVLDGLRDGVVVLDSRNRVADFNLAAAQALGWSRSTTLNQAADAAFAAWPAVAAACAGQAPPPAEVEVPGASGQRWYELGLSVLADAHNRPVGQLVVLHDISDRKAVEEELRRLVVTDALTGLPGRRRFFEALNDEVRRARRYQTPLALLVIDFDDFKRLNDRYGRQAGDEALVALSHALRQTARESDLLSRQGGDEFALLLPHTGCIGAEVVARRLLGAAQALRDPGGQPLGISIGGAELDPRAGAAGDAHGEALLARADRALYAARQAGRGGLVVAAGDWEGEAPLESARVRQDAGETG